MQRRFLVAAVAALILPAALCARSLAQSPVADPFLWLESLDSPQALAWVEKENAKTQSVLEGDPHYKTLYAEALAIYTAKDRVPAPEQLGGMIYNFWQDGVHKRGIWRRTTPASYRTENPEWETVLDLDAVNAAEKANWVWRGANCREPAEDRCLISLSDGGEDAVTVREFDIASRSFVSGGFSLPKGKQEASWLNNDALVVSREWAPGELTVSGYPFVSKTLKRGQPLSSATEVFRGEKTDVTAGVYVFRDGTGFKALAAFRAFDFFHSAFYAQTPGGWHKVNLPQKIDGGSVVAGRGVYKLNEDWTVDGTTYASGSVVSVDARATIADPDHPKPTLVFAPKARQSVAGYSVTKNRLVLIVNDNVRGRAFIFSPQPNNAWSQVRLELPENASIDVEDTTLHSDQLVLTVTTFLIPTSWYLVDAATGSIALLKQSHTRFDASKDTVEQLEATSKDGTKIPYFVVHPTAMQLDNSNPTILYGYGGFNYSETPSYLSATGKLWFERGGVFVLANIRGGGEFGPSWHEAALKLHRQVAYDDFAAVAQDLIARKITSPRRLGAQGGSNGGLLAGVMFTQHPELFHAVDIQVPLLDMLRYEQIAAGPSWVGEYGSVSVPEERAYLASYSPYNNIKAGVKYPVPYIWTTHKDDRVGPQHARKFAAKLQSLGIPYLFYEFIEGGHGSGADLNESAQTTALEFTYFTQQLMN